MRIFILLALPIASLGAQDTLAVLATEEATQAPLTSVRPRTDSLLRVRTLTDSLLGQSGPQLRLYARLGIASDECLENTDSIVAVPLPGKWPDATVESYIIRLDAGGRVVAVQEEPVSCSGDWNNSYTHYFDVSGRTTMFARYSGFFNGCNWGLAKETSVYYYDVAGKLIRKDYRLTDRNLRDRPVLECQGFMYRHDYKVYANWNAYAAARGLPGRP